MDHIDGLREHLEKDRAHLQKGVEMMKAGTFTTGEVDGAGHKTDRTSDTIELYERVVAEITAVLDGMNDRS